MDNLGRKGYFRTCVSSSVPFWYECFDALWLWFISTDRNQVKSIYRTHIRMVLWPKCFTKNIDNNQWTWRKKLYPFITSPAERSLYLWCLLPGTHPSMECTATLTRMKAHMIPCCFPGGQRSRGAKGAHVATSQITIFLCRLHTLFFHFGRIFWGFRVQTKLLLHPWAERCWAPWVGGPEGRRPFPWINWTNGETTNSREF